MSVVTSDRRAAIRISVDCAVRIRDQHHPADRLFLNATVVRICSTGLFMYVRARIWVGARLFTVVPLPPGARVAVRGYVTRMELHEDGRLGVAVRFIGTRLLPAAARVAT